MCLEGAGGKRVRADHARKYKTAEGKGENKFGCGGKTMGAAFARKVVEETHEAYARHGLALVR
eukprot:2464318-Amphidinium_carterae.1